MMGCCGAKALVDGIAVRAEAQRVAAVVMSDLFFIDCVLLSVPVLETLILGSFSWQYQRSEEQYTYAYANPMLCPTVDVPEPSKPAQTWRAPRRFSACADLRGRHARHVLGNYPFS